MIKFPIDISRTHRYSYYTTKSSFNRSNKVRHFSMTEVTIECHDPQTLLSSTISMHLPITCFTSTQIRVLPTFCGVLCSHNRIESSRDGQAVSGSPEYRRCCSEIELIIQLHNEYSDNHSSGASGIDKRPSYTSSSHDIELDTRNRPLDECLCRNRTSRPPTTHLHPLK